MLAVSFCMSMSTVQPTGRSFILEKISGFLRLLLYPFSLFYGLITWLRNQLYDRGVLSAIRFDLPTIAVGNLSVGGTGKTPHVEYLIRLLSNHFRVATLSRGYNRHSRGYLLAGADASALSIGDEPMQFHRKFPDIAVAVGEQRALALPQLLMDVPETDVVLLDDAFQHRSIQPGWNILVTEYHRPFTRDHVVPFGRLRESRRGYVRADCIIVSKCPTDLAVADRDRLLQEIRPLAHQQVFFTAFRYGECYDLYTGKPGAFTRGGPVMVACGIANPRPMMDYLGGWSGEVRLLRFPDHYYFSVDDLEKMKDGLRQMGGAPAVIVTTEKDAVRLELLGQALETSGLPIYVLPLEVSFLFGQQDHFDQLIIDYVNRALTLQNDNQIV